MIFVRECVCEIVFVLGIVLVFIFSWVLLICVFNWVYDIIDVDIVEGFDVIRLIEEFFVNF